MSKQEDSDLAAAGAVVLNHQRTSSHKLLITTDIIVYGLILAIGALEFVAWQRSDEFYRGDATYFELARSLIRDGFYGFNFKAETMLPPGFPMILASICVTVGCSHAILIRSISIFTTLGFIVTYQLLRVQQGRALAAISCLLLASSPIIFEFSTRVVFSDMPYFLFSMATLLVAVRLDSTKRFGARNIAWLLCSVLLVGSLLIRSAGIALLVALGEWLAASWFVARRDAARRIKTFLPLLILGILVQGLWMHWSGTHEVVEWPTIIGYPHSYFAQVRAKNGHYPELGTASLSDIPARVTQNLSARAVGLSALLSRKEYFDPTWYSPAVLGPILLILVGVGSSIRRGGGNWTEWYFVTHEGMYLLWPWNFDMRFFLPVAPLACLYLWRGGKVLLGMASSKGSAVAGWSLSLSVLLGACASVSVWRTPTLQSQLAAIFWALAALVSARMLWWRQWRFHSAIVSIPTQSEVVEKKFLRPLSIGGLFAVAILILVGIAQDLVVRHENLSFDVTRQGFYPDVMAAKWIRHHTSNTAVVMARYTGLVYHHSQHKVVWFPPSSDPKLLMDGIRKYHVNFIIVVERPPVEYFLPPEYDCFETLSKEYAGVFHLEYRGARFSIYGVADEKIDT